MRELILAPSQKWQTVLMLSPLMAPPVMHPVFLIGHDCLSYDEEDAAWGIVANFNRYFQATDLTLVGRTVPSRMPLHLPLAGLRRFVDDDPWQLARMVMQWCGGLSRAVLFPADRPDLAYATALLAADGRTLLFPDMGPGTVESLHERLGFLEVLDLTRENGGESADPNYLATLLRHIDRPVDYLIVTNSHDLVEHNASPDLGALWVPKVSLAAPLLAAGRRALIIDVCTPAPDGQAIEEKLNDLVQKLRLCPQYLAFVGSPGSLPPIRCWIELPKIGATWEIGREPYLRLNDDFYQDVAWGRITGLSCYDAVALVNRSLCYSQLKGSWRSKAYLISNAPPSDPNGILPFFEVLARVQEEQLSRAGLDTRADHYQEATVAAAKAGMPEAGFIFGGVHGLYTAWKLKGRDLGPVDLPQLAPAFVWTYSCTTARLAGPLAPGGIETGRTRQPASAKDSISLGFIRQGAAGYIGGTSGEDHQHSGPMAKSVLDRILFDGMSAGRALLEAKNRQIALDAVIRQVRPDLSHRKRWTFELTMAQWTLYGDPAWRPSVAAPPVQDDIRVSRQQDVMCLSVSFPPEWHAVSAAGWAKGAREVNLTVRHPKTKRLTWCQPVGPYEMWGAYLPVAPNIDGLAESALGSGYGMWCIALPEGMQPKMFRLVGCEVLDACCGCCGSTAAIDHAEALQLLRSFNLPMFLTLDHVLVRREATAAWPFDLDALGYVKFMAPTAVLDDASKRFVRFSRIEFELVLAPSAILEGSVVSPDGRPVPDLPLMAVAEEGLELGDTLTRADGSFRLKVPAGRGTLHVGDVSQSYKVKCEGKGRWVKVCPALYEVAAGHVHDLGCITACPRAAGELSVTLFAGPDLERISNALVHVVDLESAGDQEDYRGSLVAKGYSDEGGRFHTSLPEGRYGIWVKGLRDNVLVRGYCEPIDVRGDERVHVNLELVAPAVG